jgi:tetratricopeptide (TPR) repeat protein
MKISRLLARAKSHEKEGDINKAIQLYISVLETSPQNPKAIKGLKSLKTTIIQNSQPKPTQDEIDSVISLYSQGQIQESLQASKLLITKYPNEVSLFDHTGACYEALSQLDAAVSNYKQALKVMPDYAYAHFKLGDIFLSLNQLNAAVNSYQQALKIKPDYIAAYNNLGNTFKALGQLESAVKYYQRALEVKPDFVAAHNNLGNAFRELGQLETAVKYYQQALEITPDSSDVLNGLGITLNALGQQEGAVSCYEQALEIKPDFAEAHNNLGNIFQELEQLESAVKCYQRALEISPNYADAHNNLGATLLALRQLDDAVQSFERALVINPDCTAAYSNLADAYSGLGHVDAALKSYHQALNIKPNFHDARFNLSLLQLATGALSEGFKNYEVRWKRKKFTSPRRKFSIPRWTGEPLTGKNILIWGEQGIGDQIAFASIIPEFEKLACNVGIECAAKLVEVFQWTFPWAEVREDGDLNCEGSVIYSQFHYQIPMGSLAPLFRKTLNDFRIKQKPFIPRLKEGEQKVRASLKLKPGQPLIGLCWRSSLQTVKRSINYLSVEDLVPLKAIKGAVFLAVQYDDCLPELDRVRALGLPIHYYTNIDQKNDLASTCALLGACDLVISPGIAVSRLSGALGVPTIRFYPRPSKQPPISWFPTVRPFSLNPDDPSLLINDIIDQMPELIDWSNKVTTSGRNIDSLTAQEKFIQNL